MSSLSRATRIALLAFALLFAATAPAGARDIYIANNDSPPAANGSVWTFDTTTNSSAGPLAIPNPTAMAITPDGSKAYVVSDDETVSVIDTATNSVVGFPISVGVKPMAIAISPDGSRAWVTGEFGTTVVIDTATDGVVGTSPGTEGEPTAIAFTPDGAHVYVAAEGIIENGPDPPGPGVGVFEAATGLPVTEIPTVHSPSSIAVTPDGSRVYVASLDDGSVTAIDTTTNTVVGDPIDVPANPRSIAITPDGTTAYVPAGGSFLNVIDTTTNTVGQTPDLFDFLPDEIAITPDGARAYAAGAGDPSGSAEIQGVALATNTPVDDSVAIGNMQVPVAIAISPNQTPTADLAADTATAFAGEPVSFDASASTDDDLHKAAYSYDFGDGGFATTPSDTRNHVYTAPGTYDATVEVDDGEGCPDEPLFAGLASPFTGQTAHCNGPSTDTSPTVEIEVLELPILKLRLDVERPQSSLKRVETTVTCEDAECDAEARGRFKVRRPDRATKTFGLLADARNLAADTPTLFQAGIPANAKNAAQAAFRNGGSVRVKLRINATGPGDIQRQKTRRTRIER